MLHDGLSSMVRKLESLHVRHAVIGGIAVSARGHVRATRDIDFLVEGAAAERVAEMMTKLGFETLHRSDDVSNHLLGHLRVDFLYARREYTTAMLGRASALTAEGVTIRIVTTEDLIGLKVQALANDPTRTQDRADIEALLRIPADVDMALIREYFRIFEREHELDAILASIGARASGDEG